jgi:ATP-dependent Clp protease ATP-binding subunit ClpA
VRCRDDEVARLIDILLRQSKNNAALVGPAGVGKTAIAEGFAQRLVTGKVPVVLRDAKVLALDHVSLLAGTVYRGQFEERIRALIAEVSADPDVILFIDELHNLIGQGSSLGGAMDAANMLKPALVRGDFRVIGATTAEEYDRWIRGDPALERRFQRLLVRELTSEETMDVLRARVDRLEAHHNVAISPEALRASVELTDEHVQDRRRPDRAIDVLDEAAAHLQATATYPEVLEEMIVARRATRPKSRVRDDRAANPAEVEEDDAIEQFARDSFDALGRFGAELEAIISGGPGASQATNTEPVRVVPTTVVARAAEPATPTAPLDHPAMRERLLEAGIVVKGRDVARVVAMMSGHTVRWIEA